MKVIFQRIDRKSKHIKKQEKMVSENLKKKRIFLNTDDFDLLEFLEKNEPQQPQVDLSPQTVEPEKEVEPEVKKEEVIEIPVIKPESPVDLEPLKKERTVG